MKNKDGSFYVLKKPNSLGATQKFWDRSKIELHNFDWEDEPTVVTMPVGQVIDNYKSEPVSVSEPKIEEPKIEEPKIDIEPKQPEIKQEPQPEEQDEENLAFTIPKLKYIVLFHCLPVKIRYHRDELYGEDIPRLEYGEKFVFPGVFLDVTDFSIQFWTTDPNNQIGERTIVYPYRYKKGEALKDYRWWRITSKVKKEPGYVFEGVASEYQPDFSD
jgi:hypothetical protein